MVIQERVAAVLARMQAAAKLAGRDPEAVTLIAVSKTAAIDAVRIAAESGVRDFGENHVQALAARIAALEGWPATRWHMIGRLQRNKVRRAVQTSATIHSVDSLDLARAIDAETALQAREIEAFVQVNVSGEPSKAGFTTEAVHAAAGELSTLSSLHWRGLMTIAPEAAAGDELRSVFAGLRRLHEELAPTFHLDTWNALSMGMTNDFETAIEEGATHVRVGRAIFGERSAPLLDRLQERQIV